MTVAEVPGTGEVAFGPLTIRYDDRVLRPRPWTVRQSTWASELLPGLPPGDVLEVCCGAGQIGLLATSGSDRRLVQVDANPDACDYARMNAASAMAAGLGPRGGVEVRHGALEVAVDDAERFALVLADPPYLRRDRVAEHPEDPVSAIDGGTDGLDLVRVCLDLVDRHLVARGAALVQVGGQDQVAAIAAYLSEAGRDLAVASSEVTASGALALLQRETS